MEVWQSIGTSVLFGALSVWIIARGALYLSDSTASVEHLKFSRSLLFTYGAMCQVGKQPQFVIQNKFKVEDPGWRTRLESVRETCTNSE